MDKLDPRDAALVGVGRELQSRGYRFITVTPATHARMRTAAAAVLQRPILRRGTVTANVEVGLRFRGLSHAAARRPES